MGVGRAGTDENLAFPELLEAEMENVRAIQSSPESVGDLRHSPESSETRRSSNLDAESENSDSALDRLVTGNTHGSGHGVPDRQCTSICGKILRIMGDEQTSRTYGRHLRSMGDEIFCRYAIRRSLDHLVQAVSNERDSSRETVRHQYRGQRPRRPSSSENISDFLKLRHIVDKSDKYYTQ